MANIYTSMIIGLFACNSDKQNTTEDVNTENANPVATITSHADDVELTEGSLITFQGTVSDEDHDFEKLEAQWLFNGTVGCDFETVTSEGTTSCEHTISIEDDDVTLVVRDSAGASGEDQVYFKVEASTPPTVEITNPVEDGIYYTDMPILFDATVSDTDEGVSTLTGVWESTGSGVLEEVAFAPNDSGETSDFGILPTEGEHTVTLTVTDSSGKSSTDTVVVNVNPPNTAPSCELTSPIGGSCSDTTFTDEGDCLSTGNTWSSESFLVGDEIVFSGTGNDIDVPYEMLTVTVSSDIDGELYSGVPNEDGTFTFNSSTLSVNTHTVSLTVSDEIGATCTDSAQIIVNEEPETGYLVTQANYGSFFVNEVPANNYGAGTYSVNASTYTYTIDTVTTNFNCYNFSVDNMVAEVADGGPIWFAFKTDNHGTEFINRGATGVYFMNDPEVHTMAASVALATDADTDNSLNVSNLDTIFDPNQDATTIYFNAFWDPSTRYFVIFRSTDGLIWDLVVRGNPAPVSTYVRAFFHRRTGSGTTMQLIDAIDLSSMDPLFPY